MNNSNLVRTNVADGVELFYFADRQVTGIHLRGLARMLNNCNPTTISRIAEGVTQSGVVTLEMPTAGGVQGVTVLLESVVPDVLIAILRGKYQKRTIDAAEALLRKFASAGFKLHAMFQVAPQELAKAIGYEATAAAGAVIASFDDLKTKAALAIELANVPGAVDVFNMLIQAQHVVPAAVQAVIEPAPAIQTTLSTRIIHLAHRYGEINTAMVLEALRLSGSGQQEAIHAAFKQLAASGKGEIRGSAQYPVFGLAEIS